MDFFKSVVSDDPVSLKPDQDNQNLNPSTDRTSGGWSFGGLIKNFAARSESVLETYRRDLKEFGSGLRNETHNLREIASRAVKELPASLESLESVSNALDKVIKSTGEIVSKESLVFALDGESEARDTKQSLGSGGLYSWFESQLSLIQNDANTFCQEPDGADEYNEWKLRFDLGDKKGEIDNLIGGNGALEGVYKRVVVPGVVDPETFWHRYFYRLHKLEQRDRMRANLTRMENPDDDDGEELSWDVDDDDDNCERGIQQKTGVEVDGSGSVGSGDRTLNHLAKQEGSSSKSHDVVDKNNIMESSSKSNEKLSSVERMRSEDVEVKIDQKTTLEESGLKKYDDMVLPLDEKMDLEEKGESLKKSDASAIVNEEDSEWDEIEDVGSGDEKKISVDGDTTNRAELRKLISAAVDDEDLSWDIEDDDEPAKA